MNFLFDYDTGIAKMQKPLPVWIYSKDNKEQKGLLTGGSATTVLIYPGSMKEYKNQSSPQSLSFSYERINFIKIKKAYGLIEGLAKGGLIGLTPIAFGEGGAYVSIIAIPLGVIIGSIVGATSKKKFEINGDLNSFQKFTKRVIK
jgi:hypothetical protein